VSIDIDNLEELLGRLPEDIRVEVRDFVEFLLSKRRPVEGGRKLSQKWAGVLKDYRDKYTSLDLQKKALDWRGD
jgi:hypothetical protein